LAIIKVESSKWLVLAERGKLAMICPFWRIGIAGCPDDGTMKSNAFESKFEMELAEIRIPRTKLHAIPTRALDPRLPDRRRINRISWRQIRHCQFVFIFSIVFFFSGCEQANQQLTPVSGKVSFQNQLLPRGAIVFVPDSDRGNNGPLAQGTIQGEGRYTIQTAGQPGAMPGWYRVTVISVEETNSGSNRVASLAPRSLVPERYRDPRLTDLVCEVKAGEANVINFNLTP
jgi:hypothetical protein